MSSVASQELSIEKFEAGDIDPELFNHEAHVYVGWLYVCAYPLGEVLANFDVAIERFVTKLGAQQKYHATITWFFLLLIAERMKTGESWQDFAERNADLLTDSKTVLNRYYTHDLLFSDKARKRFVLPDKLSQE